LGHSLTPADEARARAVIERTDPLGAVAELVEGLGEILKYPLLVVLSQVNRRCRVVARVAFFVGEGEPIPREIELGDPVFEWEAPYICTPDGLLPLAPGLVYEPRASDGRLGLHLLDGIDEDELRYKGLHDDRAITRGGCVSDIGNCVQLPFVTHPGGVVRPTIERIRVIDGRSLFGFLSGTEPASRNADAPTDGSNVELETIRGFEQNVNSLGLGAAYRDIVYCLADFGARAELSRDVVRAVTSSEPSRVLATIQVTTKPSLLISLLVGALTTKGDDSTEAHEVKPGQPGDAVVARIQELKRA
jgi:hypothetical protein